MTHSSNPFGVSSTTGMFGSQSVFGQTTRTSDNPFDSSTRGLPFPGTGVFGYSAPAFDTSTSLSMGISSTSSLSFGLTPSQISPLGNTLQQTHPLYGSNSFVSATPFITYSQPAFSLVPLLWVPQGHQFIVSQQPLHCGLQLPHHSMPQFHHHLGLQQINCPLPHLFDSQARSVFCDSSSFAYGSSNTAAFGSNNITGGFSSAPVFIAPLAPCLAFGTIPFLGQSICPVGSNPFGSTVMPFGTQRFTNDNQKVAPVGNSAFGQPLFGVKQGGTRVAAYSPTPEVDGATIEGVIPQMESISAMVVYKDRSHEELRWEDYQHHDRGNHSAIPAGSSVFGQSSFGAERQGSRVAPYTPTLEATGASDEEHMPQLESISAMFVYKDKSHEELRWEDYHHGYRGGPNSAGQDAGGVTFAASTLVNPFGSLSSSTGPKTTSVGSASFTFFPTSGFKSYFGISSNSFDSTYSSTSPIATSGSPANSLCPSSPFCGYTKPACSSSSSMVGPSTVGSSSAFGSLDTGDTKASSLFQSSPSIGLAPSMFSSSSSSSSLDGCRPPAFSSSISIFGSSTVGSSSASGTLDGCRPPAFGSSISIFGSSTVGSSSASGTLDGCRPPAFSSSISIFGSSTVGSSSASSTSSTLVDLHPSGLLHSSATSFEKISGPFGLRGFSSFSGATAPNFSSSPSITTNSVRGSSSAFNSSFASGNFQTSDPSMASTASIAFSSSSPFSALSTPSISHSNSTFVSSTAASSSAALDSSPCHTQADHSKSSNTSNLDTQSPCGMNLLSPFCGLTIPAFSSNASSFGSSAVDSTSGFGSFCTLDSANNRSSGILQSNPFAVQTSSMFGLNSSLPPFGSSSKTFGASVIRSSGPGVSSMSQGTPQSSGFVQSSTESIGQTSSASGTSPFSFSFYMPSIHHTSAPSTFSTSNPMVSYQVDPSFLVSSKPAAPVQTSIAFPEGGIGRTQPPAFCDSGTTASLHDQDILRHRSPGRKVEEAATGTSMENGEGESRS